MATYDIITQKMTFGGKSFGKIDGKTVFVPFALPGEKLRVETVKSKCDWEEVRITEILEPSPRRTAPSCPLYQNCGGCNLMHADYAFQLEMKKQVCEDIFKRAQVPIPPMQIFSKNPLGYRNRMEFFSGGLRERGTKNVIQLGQCPVAAPEINGWLSRTPIERRPKNRAMVFGSERAEPNLTVAEIFSEKNSRKERFNDARKEKVRMKQGTSQTASHPVELSLCGKKIAFDAKGFFQSNVGMLELAVPKIISKISGSRVLDLYSGCGTFSVFLAENFSHVTMVEHNKGAVVFAEQNMAGIPHSTFAVSGAEFAKSHAEIFSRQHGAFDTVFADPPRSGMEKEVVEWLCESGIPKIAYLSCDTATQARDVAKLSESGYIVEEAWLLDFYPQTSHIETFLICIKN